MAQGVKINYGTCDGGPWHGKQMADARDEYLVPIDVYSKKVHVAVQPGTPGYKFGRYCFDGKVWRWSFPPD